jgi:hypothetical protein
MTWMEEWKALHARILGLLESGNFFFRSVPSVGGDYCGVGSKVLIPGAKQTFLDLKAFSKQHEKVLPEKAKASLDNFISKCEEDLTKSTGGLPGVQQVMTVLSGFAAEFDYYLTDADVVSRSLAERAFLHLQRSIVADTGISEKWQIAFKAGETNCEKLGAAHLLSHGIWGFKAHGAGERTDLILGEQVDVDVALRAGTRLVLTEWKVAASPSDAEKKSEEAFAQAQRYGQGILGGFELKSTRYVVIVSPDFYSLPAERNHGGTQYRFVNIAVKPSTPSKAK